MNKQEFMDELRTYLSILEDKEQEDILEEYAQHIEMKMERGLTEEEAIRDFGRVKELAAQILEAYHVKLEREPRETEKGKTENFKENFFRGGREAGKKGKRLLAKGKERIKQWKASCGKILASIGNQAAGCIKRLWNRLFRPAGKRRPIQGNEFKERGTSWREEGRSLWNSTVSGAKGLCLLVLRILRFCFRLAWNGAVVISAGFLGISGLLALFVLGLLAVLWGQGYPFFGLVMGSFGLVLCFGSLMVIDGALYWKKQPVKQTAQKKRWIRMAGGGVFCLGVLLGGIGTGIAFGDFSSFTYRRIKLPEEIYDSQKFSLPLEAEREEIRVAAFAGGQRCVITEDESVPSDVLEVSAVYDSQMYEADAWWDGEQVRVEFYNTGEISDMERMMEWKDQILAGIKAREIRDYQMDWVKSVEYRVNPADRERIVFY